MAVDSPRRIGRAVTSLETAAACAVCGDREHYRVVRRFGGEWVDVTVCRRCGGGSPLVRELDRVTEELFGE